MTYSDRGADGVDGVYSGGCGGDNGDADKGDDAIGVVRYSDDAGSYFSGGAGDSGDVVFDSVVGRRVS